MAKVKVVQNSSPSPLFIFIFPLELGRPTSLAGRAELVPRTFNPIPRIPSAPNPHQRAAAKALLSPPPILGLEQKMLSSPKIIGFSLKKTMPRKLLLLFLAHTGQNGNGELRCQTQTTVPKSASEVQHESTTLESPLPSLKAQPNIPSARQKTNSKPFWKLLLLF